MEGQAAEVLNPGASDLTRPARQYWPEPLRDEPRVDPFPWIVVLKWLLPGLIAMALLLSLYVFLDVQSRKQIITSSGSGAIRSIRADGQQFRTVDEGPLTLDAAAQAELSEIVPLLTGPRWSADNQRLAATVSTEGEIRVVVFSTDRIDPTFINSTVSNVIAMSSNGWSPDGTRLALIEQDGTQARLSFVHVLEDSDTSSSPAAQSEPTALLAGAELAEAVTPVDLALDTRAGFDWHPQEHLVLATVQADNLGATLQFINADGTTAPFLPIDNQVIHGDGVWSPDGSRIAYIATEVEAGHPNLLKGNLWIADRSGQGTRQLTSDHDYLAPVWDTNGGGIYVTRHLTATDSFELYYVGLFADEPVRVGASSLEYTQFPFDRERFHSWQGDERSLAIATQPLPLTVPGQLAPSFVVRRLIQRALPVRGLPHWSPDGQHWVTTTWEDGKIRVALYDDNNTEQPFPASGFDVMAAPGDGWSADGSHLAVLEYDGARALLTLVNVNQPEQVRPYDFSVDTRAGMDWHPTTAELLLTTQTPDDPTPNLQIVDTVGNTTVFAPADGQIARADGAWSPDGLQIAYIAGDTYTTIQDVLPGSLWVVNRDGTNLRQLVSEAEVIAPLWSPTGDAIYFTRFHTSASRFELFRVLSDGTGEAEYIGPSTEAVVLFPFDRRLLLNWSRKWLVDSERQLLFQGEGQQLPAFYLDRVPSQTTLDEVHQQLPVIGAPRWSPDGTQLAGTAVLDGYVGVTLVKPAPRAPFSFSSDTTVAVMPADGWSPDGRYLAILQHDGEKAILGYFNAIEPVLTSANLTLDTRAGLSWHPDGGQIMVTTLQEGITPTLQIVDVATDGESLWMPTDDQVMHADGVWSPDGQLVAYIAQETYSDTVELLTGSLWIANSDGRNPRRLTTESDALAPIWDLANGRILFTRSNAATTTFDLYEVDLGSGEVGRIGLSTSAFAEFPFDRQLFLRWTPEGRRWVLPRTTPANTGLLFRVDANGANIHSMQPPCPTARSFVAQWAPHGRAILFNCSSAVSSLQWVTGNRDSEPMPTGIYASWEP